MLERNPLQVVGLPRLGVSSASTELICLVRGKVKDKQALALAVQLQQYHINLALRTVEQATAPELLHALDEVVAEDNAQLVRE